MIVTIISDHMPHAFELIKNGEEDPIGDARTGTGVLLRIYLCTGNQFVLHATADLDKVGAKAAYPNKQPRMGFGMLTGIAQDIAIDDVDLKLHPSAIEVRLHQR